MYGLDAISAHNGWAISIVGIFIVFSGLILLSLAISQLHKMLDFWDNREEYRKKFKQRLSKAPQPPEAMPVFTLPQAVGETARQFKLLVNWLGEPFALPKLLELAQKSGLLRPHAAVNDLIHAGHIVPDGKGYFTWKS